MKKVIAFILLVVFFELLSVKAFAFSASCKFKSDVLEGVDSIELNQGVLVVNNKYEIPLVESEVYCGANLRSRLDGASNGYQVVLKSCSVDGSFEGYIFDSSREASADVVCDPNAD